MSRIIVVLFLLVVLIEFSFANSGFQDRPITHNVIMPTGYTLNKGEFQVGIGPLAFGLSDHIQIGTDVLCIICGSPYINLRANLYNLPEHALAVGVGFGRTIAAVSSKNIEFIDWHPFLAYSRPLSPKTRFHLSLGLAIFGNDDIKNATPQRQWRGAGIDAGLEYSYSNRSKFLAEGGYDFTFEGPRIGGAALWGWNTFRLKLGVDYYKPQGLTHAFWSPIIGFWWRLGGTETRE